MPRGEPCPDEEAAGHIVASQLGGPPRLDFRRAVSAADSTARLDETDVCRVLDRLTLDVETLREELLSVRARSRARLVEKELGRLRAEVPGSEVALSTRCQRT
jgi:hypothetical protein